MRQTRVAATGGDVRPSSLSEGWSQPRRSGRLLHASLNLIASPLLARPAGVPSSRERCRSSSRDRLAASQQVVHNPCRLPVHGGQNMAVGVEGDRYRGVAQHLRHLLRIDITTEQ
jgi:hypothetical protein